MPAASDSSALPRLAFLGPEGTYSHQVANEHFSESVEYKACKSIADVFYSVNETFQFGLLPQENSIFGMVIETYDLLRSDDVGRTKWIRGAVTLPVQHCLLVRKGQKLHNIKRLLSHEQALGQCSQFIAKHLPDATLVKTASTAAAAEFIATHDKRAESAAICSKFCTTLFDNLQALHEGIQNVNFNFTRFYILANDLKLPLPLPPSRNPRQALVRIDVGPPLSHNTECLSSVSITDLLGALRLSATRIDRRPSLEPSKYRHTYFVEVIDRSRSASYLEKEGRGDEVDEKRWADKVFHGAGRVIGAGGGASVLGIW